jgi:hypothetical protein
MTYVSRFTGSTCVLAIGVLIASSACAAQTSQSRRRAVAPPVAGPAIPIVGVVKDASNGLPVQLATAAYGDQTAHTNANGEFTLNLPTGSPVTVSIQHPGFLPLTKAVTAQSGVKVNFAITGLPSVTIKTTAGTTYIIDIGTAQFAYRGSSHAVHAGVLLRRLAARGERGDEVGHGHAGLLQRQLPQYGGRFLRTREIDRNVSVPEIHRHRRDRLSVGRGAVAG